MTRLLVLGGGRHQVPLIERAQSRGVDVVMVDYLVDAPGRSVATYPELADATDSDAATRIAKEYDVDGVITTGTDIPLRAMAAVAEALELPRYLSSGAAHSATDKEAMHKALREAGVQMANRAVVGSDDASIDFDTLPVVVKPADSQGQRGITLVSRRDRISEAVSKALSSSRTGRVVIEEYLSGPEFTANAWIEDDRVALLMVNDRVTFNPGPSLGIAFQHRYPSQAAAGWMGEVESMTKDVAIAYGLEQGPLYIQMITTDHGPVVVEAAARIGGGHESRMLLTLNRWSTDDALIDLALGIRPAPPPTLPETAHVLVNFVLGSAGEVDRLVEPELTEGVVESSWYVGPGTRLADVVDSLGRVGYFVAEATSTEQLVNRAAEFYATLELPSVEGKNLVHIPDPALLNLP
jgi:biotin carboxylase